MAVSGRVHGAARLFPAAISAAILGALILGSLASTAVFAENVPLPTPAPLPKTGSSPPPAPAESAPADASQHKGFFPFSLPSLGSGLSPQATAFDPKQRALLDRVSQYLSSVQTMVGNFV